MGTLLSPTHAKQAGYKISFPPLLLQLTDAIEGKKKPPSRDETNTSALEMVQMAETDSEVESPL